MIRPLALLLVFSAAISADLAAAAPPQITGRILHPPKDVQVELRPWSVDQAEALQRLKREAVPPLASAKPRADGSFAIKIPDTGFYSVVVRAEGRLALEAFAAFVVEDMELPPVELPAASPLEIRALGADGQPLANVTIQAVPLKPDSEEWAPAGRSAVTDAEGKAVFSRAEGEALSLVVTTPGRYATASASPAGAPQTIRFPAQKTRTVEFRGADGKPAAGTLVRLARKGWPYGLTGQDGRIALPVPLQDEIGLFAEDAKGLRIEAVMTVEAGEGTDVPVLTLRSPTPAAGKVLETSTREPIAGALVWNAGTAWTRTGPGGEFELRAPSGDRGRIEASAAGRTRALFRWQRDANAPVTLLLEPAAPLSGQVVDEAGKPVADARVAAMTNPADFRGTRMEERKTWTGADGRFTLRQMPAGRLHKLIAAKEGFAPANQAGDTNAPVRLTLRRGTAAVGRVVDDQGLPVVGATLTLGLPDSDPMGMPMAEPELSFHGVADAQGRFRIPNVSAGRFELQAARPGFSTAFVSGVQIAEGEPEADLGDVTLFPGAAIEGIVVDERDRPVRGAHVYLNLSGSERGDVRLVMSREPVDTDADGRFRLVDLPRGTRIGLTVAHDELLSADMPGVEVPTGQPLRIRLMRPRNVMGRVVDGLGEPVAGARLYVSDSSLPPLGGGWERRPSQAVTDPEGKFVLPGAKPGAVYVIVIASGYRTRQEQVQVPEQGQAPPVEIALEPGTFLEGFVLDSQGNPLARASVFAQGPDLNSFRMAVPTDEEGRYEIGDLEPGPHQVQASLYQGPSVARPVEIRPGRNRLDLKLAEGTEVSGRIVDGLGSPIPGASLSLRPERQGTTEMFRPDAQTVSAADGSFVFQGVADGEYRLQGIRQGFAPASIPGLQVAGSPISGLELRLGPGAVIRGRLLGLDPVDWSRVRVMAFSPEAGTHLEGAVDTSGSYRVQDVPPGEWYLTAHLSAPEMATAQVEVGAGEPEVVQNLEFPTGYTLTGRVLLDRSPLSGAQVMIQSTNPEKPAGGQRETAHDGTFRMERLPAGTYTLMVMTTRGVVHSGTIEVRGDDEITVEIAAGDPPAPR
jgi:protocatechuate 3,4-dioxygenase beta subunit